MYMAESAPRVDPALAMAALETERASAEQAIPTEAPRPERVDPVEPAVAGMVPVVAASVEPMAPMSVEALRGGGEKSKNGSLSLLLESPAAVVRGAPEKNFLHKALPFLFQERDVVSFGQVQRYVVIKGDCCFVFGEKTDPKPLYAIPLTDLKPYMEDRNRPDKDSFAVSPSVGSNVSKEDLETVLLKYPNGHQAFQFTFNTQENPSAAQRFYDAFEQQPYRTTNGKYASSLPPSQYRSKN